jgi:HEAT repeat protein
MFWTRWQTRARDPEARKRAAVKLGETGGRRALKPLVGLLEDPEWTVRVAAIEALGALAQPSAVEPLIAAIRNAEGVNGPGAAEVRGAAVAALQRAGPAAVPPLRHSAGDKSPKVREAAIEALGGIGDAEAVPTLVAALSDDRSNVRQAAARALTRVPTFDSVAVLLPSLDHRDPATRRSVVEALGETGDARAAEALSRIVTDRERPVRDAAVKALGRIGSQRAVDALIGAFQGPDRDLRQAAGDRLKGMTWEPRDGRERAIAAILRGDYAASAAEGAVAVEPLVAALGAKDPAARKAVAEALGSLHDARAARPLASLLADRDDSARSAAARALVEIGPPGATSVIDMLDDRAGPVREAAVGILRDTGAARVVSHLMSGLNERGFVRDEPTQLTTTSSSGAFDRARSLVASLEALLGHVARLLDEKTLTCLATLFDIGLISRPPPRGADLSDGLDDRISCANIRKRAGTELKRRGIAEPPGRH